MNKIELITGLPDWHWKPNSQREITMNGIDLVKETDFIWRIGNVAVAGFIHASFLSPPWMWFVLAENVTIADLIDFRRLAQLRIPKGTLTCVGADFEVGLKFAKIYGFAETGGEVIYSDRQYKIMRKI
jgi:hypothetical protein